MKLDKTHLDSPPPLPSLLPSLLVWEIGDFVVQVPWDCFPVPDCVNGSSETYMYAYHGGLVKITPRMMPNEDGWIKEANWIGDFKIGFKGLVATHMCSYWCWYVLCCRPRSPPPSLASFMLSLAQSAVNVPSISHTLPPSLPRSLPSSFPPSGPRAGYPHHTKGPIASSPATRRTSALLLTCAFLGNREGGREGGAVRYR